jgi:RNA polymerase sigma-70 factor, ECF subfamily
MSPTKRTIHFLYLVCTGLIMMTENIATLDDRTLIEMTIAGQTECFSVLIDRHATTAKRCISLIVRRTQDVEDILQNTFLKAWVNLSSFRFEAGFRSWLIRIAMNEAFQYHRYYRCRPSCPDPAHLDELACARDSPEQRLQRSEATRNVRLAIARLPSKYREVVRLCDIQQLTAIETARHLKSSVALVKTRRFRARNMLSAALRQKGAGGVVMKKAA